MKTFYTILLSALLATVSLISSAKAGGAEEPSADPKVLLRMLQGMESSGIDQITSRISENGTYHLRDFHYLGTVQRDGQTYSIAHAKFIRSRPADRDTPPARGHDFIIVFNGAFKVASFGRVDMGSYRMEGNLLLSGKDVLADFSANDHITKESGFIRINLPYPFSRKK